MQPADATTTSTFGRRRGRRGVRVAGLAGVVIVVVGAVSAMSAGGPDALIPQPTSTTTSAPGPVPTRPQRTTTTAVAGSLPGPSTTVAPIEPATTVAVAPVTPPPAPPTGGPVPEPPVSTSVTQVISPASEGPELSEPETAPFVKSSPVTVDPENPAVQPPVVVDVAIYCVNGTPGAKVLVQNVDPYHYPPPFEAHYDWELTDGSSVLDDGSFDLAAWDTRIVYTATPAVAGTFVFTIVDDELDASASADVVLPDCSTEPAPSLDPAPPVVIVPSVACAEDFGADNGSGSFTFAVYNEPNDDGSVREYEFAASWVDEQVLVAEGPLGTLASTQWADGEVLSLHSGTYMLGVSDVGDFSLGANVSVEVPPCDPDVPPVEPVPPLNAPTIVDVTTQCADPVLLDGRADFYVLNDNYQVLGGTGELVYDWTLSLGSVVESASGHYLGTPGLHTFFEAPLAPGDYTATITVTDFPELTDSATFTIYDCTGAQPDHGLVIIAGWTTMCFPGDPAETLLFFVHHYAQPQHIGWKLVDGATTIAEVPELALDGTFGNSLSAANVPAGTYDLVVTSFADPAGPATTAVEIAPCPATGDPLDPSDPVEGVDPSDPSDPVDPVNPIDPVDPADPASATEAVTTGPTASSQTGMLPPTR